MSLSRSFLICCLCPNYRYLSAYTCKLNKSVHVSSFRMYQARCLPCYNSLFSENGKAYFSVGSNCLNNTTLKKGPESDKPKKLKKELKTYITLLDIDNNISVTTVEDASKLALRRNYKLVKVVNRDPKTDRAVYQLVTESQYLKEDMGWEDTKIKNEKTRTDSKVMSFSSNINENDVTTKVNKIKKWLTKNYEVRVVITGDSTARENIYKIIEKDVGADGRIVQKRVKGADIRFQILAPKKTTEKSSEVSGKETL